MSTRAEIERHAAFMEEAARYFEKRDTGGEDMAFWANVANAETCRKVAADLSALLAQVEALKKERDEALRWQHNYKNAADHLADDLEECRAGRNILSTGSWDTSVMFMNCQKERDQLAAEVERLREALGKCQTNITGYVAYQDATGWELTAKDMFRELRRIHSVAGAVLKQKDQLS